MLIVALPAYLAAQTKAAAKAAAANPNEVMHIYECEITEGKSNAQAEEAARDYLEALRQLDGAKDLKMKVLWPVAVNNLRKIDFYVVLISPSFTDWGRMWDAYKDDTAAAKFEDLQGVADCNDSAVWEAVAIEAKK
jgi:hypothetical protein